MMGKKEWRHTLILGGEAHQERVLIEEKKIKDEVKEEKQDWAQYHRRDQATGKVEPGGGKEKEKKGKGKKK